MEKENIKEKIKYNELLRRLVESNYDDILIKQDKDGGFTVYLKKSGWVSGYNCQEYKTFIYYYDFDFEEMTDFVIDLLGERKQAVLNTTFAIFKKNYEIALKEMENILDYEITYFKN